MTSQLDMLSNKSIEYVVFERVLESSIGQTEESSRLFERGN